MTFLFTMSMLAMAQKSDDSSWTYSEGWWEVYSISESDSLQYDSNVLFPESEVNGRLRIYNRATTELNTRANRHGVTLTVRILDAQTKTVLAENSEYGFYTNENTSLVVTASHITKPGEEEIPPIETNLVQITHCPGDIGGGGGTTTGYFGVSLIRYDFSHAVTPGLYQYNHQTNHPAPTPNVCPTYCAFIVDNPLPVYSKKQPPNRIRIVVPWGPLGCLYGGLEVRTWQQPTTCYDISYSGN